MPKQNLEKNCPCHSALPYSRCCAPYHAGLHPENAEKLMRSRYSAYALNLPGYLIETTHPENPQFSDRRALWKEEIRTFSEQTTFKSLEILSSTEEGAFATVTFVAGLAHKGKDVTFTERSLFEKVDGRWLYKEGKTAAGRVLDL